jgi:hypothetical protein
MDNLCRYTIILSIVISVMVAQSPDTLWTKTFGGSNSDIGEQVYQTIDGGYIILSNTESYGPGWRDLWLLKTDANGDTVWTKLYGNAYGVNVTAFSPTNDSGYIVTGSTEQSGASEDLWLMKIDITGDSLWTVVYAPSNGSMGFSVKQTFDGGFIVAGEKYGVGYGDTWLLKTDSQGDTTWTRTYSWPDFDYGDDVIQTSDSGYVVAGTTIIFGPSVSDIWLLRTNAQGDSLWKKTWGGSEQEYCAEVLQTADGGFLVLGTTNSYGAGRYDVWLIRTDDMGDTLWTRTYGSSDGDECYSLKKTPDGGYIMAGVTGTASSGTEAYIIKVDSVGDAIWSSTFGGSADDWLRCIEPTADEGYVGVGYTYSYGAGESDVWLIKTAPDTLGIQGEPPTAVKQSKYSSTIITGPLPRPVDKPYKIFDITGRQIHTLDHAPGIYLIQVDDKIAHKVVKIR